MDCGQPFYAIAPYALNGGGSVVFVVLPCLSRALYRLNEVDVNGVYSSIVGR